MENLSRVSYLTIANAMEKMPMQEKVVAVWTKISERVLLLKENALQLAMELYTK